ncbi:ArdC family protein [Vibrio algivorus]|uniref:DUF1738 domain-containing protein n=1 Tax=Vibrio algivorus TaxID=1667024 RepID=A0A557PGW8_9VIBR|nr:zincin-like metallopeptidase domain-containing protein [Vibrio algivorus]TVO39904.1 DUF1738 domain-containing protein [Vibrio algivorus]
MATALKCTHDFHQEITNQVIEALESGVKPWQCPWDTSISSSIPYNGSTGKSYSGMNIMLLWMASIHGQFSSPIWLTFKQAQALGGMVRKGEKGTRIFFYTKVEKKDVVTDEDKSYSVIKTYTVFNADQVDGLNNQSISHAQPSLVNAMDIDAFLAATGASVVENGLKAFYRPSTDQIVLPFRHRFNCPADFEATALHELTHWTGHKKRCDRKLGNEYGSKDYALEELVAELGSAFLMAEMGTFSDNLQHESYIASWLQALKNDKRYVFKAASMAQKAYAYIMDTASRSCMDAVA